MKDSSLPSVIDRTLSEMPGADDAEVAAAVIEAYPTRKALAAAVFGPIRAEVVRHRRATVRDAERQIERALSGRPVEPEGAANLASALSSGDLSFVYFVYDSSGKNRTPRRVDWATATVEDHQARIDFLDRYMAGLGRTKQRHQRAIEVIQEAGATCLADVDGWTDLLDAA